MHSEVDTLDPRILFYIFSSLRGENTVLGQGLTESTRASIREACLYCSILGAAAEALAWHCLVRWLPGKGSDPLAMPCRLV